jgi:hypothetical protein
MALLSNVPFITNIFPDSNPDYPHVLPVDKCVWEIDQSKITANSLNAFWKQFSGLECETYKAKATQQNTDLAGQLGTSIRTRDRLKTQVTAANAEYTQLQTQARRLKSCETTNTQLQQNIDDINAKYDQDVKCSWQGVPQQRCAPGLKSVLDSKSASLSNENQSSLRQKASAYDAYTVLQKRNTKLNTDNAFLTTEVSTLSNSVNICTSNDLPKVTESNQILTQSIAAYNNEVTALTKDIEVLKAQVSRTASDNERLRTSIRTNSDIETENLRVLYACQATLKEKQRIIEETKPEVLRLRRLKQQCDVDLINSSDLYNNLIAMYVDLYESNQTLHTTSTSLQYTYADTVDKLVNKVSTVTPFTCANDYQTAMTNLKSIIKQKEAIMGSNLAPEYVPTVIDATWCANPANSNYIAKCCPPPPPPPPKDLCQVFKTDAQFDLEGALWEKLVGPRGVIYRGNGRGNENPKLDLFYNTMVNTNPPYLRLWFPNFSAPVDVKLQGWVVWKDKKKRTILEFEVGTEVFQPKISGKMSISSADPYPVRAQFVNCLSPSN